MRCASALLLVASFLCSAFTSEAGAQTLSGLVGDQSRGTPVVLARVTLLGPDSLPVVSGLTNLSGYFSVTAPEGGGYWVSIEANFYRTHEAGPVLLTAGDTSSVAIALLPQAVEVEGLVVEARRRATRMIQGGYYERYESGLGWQVDREEIEKRAHFNVTEALRAIPGVILRPTGFGGWEPVISDLRNVSTARSRKRCYPRVYIDGLLFSQGGAFPNDLDRAVKPDDVEAIEVFESPWVPSQFNPSLARCGVIAVWRR